MDEKWIEKWIKNDLLVANFNIENWMTISEQKIETEGQWSIGQLTHDWIFYLMK